MSKPELKDQLESFAGYVNDIPLVIDPCKMCKVFKDNESFDIDHNDEQGNYIPGTCTMCCWFYDSKFEVEKC